MQPKIVNSIKRPPIQYLMSKEFYPDYIMPQAILNGKLFYGNEMKQF